MEYHEAANTLFDLRRYATRPGTAATAALLSHLDDPQEDYHCVQVAGSNGKGSTARMLASILAEAGLSVGLYTSPHLDYVGERIRVDGRPLSKAALSDFVETVEPYLTETAADGESPTFFETLTGLACWEFGRQDVDVAVLEVGIGGARDATSAVDPVASAVTSVTLEHTAVLGDTVAEIARDKAQVAPADRPLVTAATGSALDAIEETVGQPLVVGGAGTSLAADAANGDDGAADPDVTVDYGGRDGLEGIVRLAGPDWDVSTHLPLLGAHQARNAGVAAALARQLDDADIADVGAEDLARGLRNAHWAGRFEVMGREPLVVLDGAHNPGGCAAVAETLETFEYDDLHLVVGAMADKDLRGMARALSVADQVIACEPDRARAEEKDAIARAFETETDATVETRAAVRDALADALDSAGPDDCVLVLGSLYAVAEARTRWTRTQTPTTVDSIDGASETLTRADVTHAGTWRMRGKAVHRVLKTRVRPRQAQYLKEELLSLGGECAVSGVDAADEEPVPVVTMATMAQYKRLIEKLAGQPYGLTPLGEEIRETLGIGTGPTGADEGDYPWTGDRTAVMGILNVTPDSFHDGGEFADADDAVARAREMVEAGADVIDVGGESTRPGADPVPVEEEIDRVVPVIEAIADLDVRVSIDTRKATVARAALEAGADLLNDVSGLADPEMRLVAAEFDVPVVVMHSIDAPVDPDRDVHYDDVVDDVIADLTERVLLAEKAGLERSQIIVDPGLGFGKSAAESLELLDRAGELRALGCPILIGHSHKSMFAPVERDDGDRREATVAGTALAAERGADVVRVHDVAANRAAVDVVHAATDCDSLDGEN